jgi:hypothetical protein
VNYPHLPNLLLSLTSPFPIPPLSCFYCVIQMSDIIFANTDFGMFLVS